MKHSNNKPVFKAIESPLDNERVTSEMVTKTSTLPPTYFSISLFKPSTNDLCSQKRCGICTACTVRMTAEVHFNDGVRLSEWWLYLMGKALVEKAQDTFYEGSAILYMLKCANKYGIPTKDMEIKYPLKTDGSYAEFIADFIKKYGGQIPQPIMNNAVMHMIPGYYQVTLDPVSLAREISEGRALSLMIVVGDNTYKDKNGVITWVKSILCPWAAPKNIEGGHGITMSEYKGLDINQLLTGPQSWGTEYCKDLVDSRYSGFINFIFATQKPYLREAWAISSEPVHIPKTEPVPVPVYDNKGNVTNWYQRFLILLKNAFKK